MELIRILIKKITQITHKWQNHCFVLSKFVPQALLSKVTDEKKKNDHLKEMVGMTDKEHNLWYVT